MIDSAGRQLPPNWRTAKAEDGKEYYFNELTGETSWALPASAPAPPNEHKVPPLVSEPEPMADDDDDEPASMGFERAAPMEATEALPEHAVVPMPAEADPNDLRPGLPPMRMTVVLGSDLPKLLVVGVASFTLMLQASIEYSKASQESYVPGRGRVFVGDFPFAATAYGVSVGTVSLALVIAVLALARFKPQTVSEWKLPLPKERGHLSFTQLYSAFLFTWWAVGVGVLTFHAPYTYTCNAYFASWVGVFASALILARAFTQIHTAWNNMAGATASDDSLQYDVLLLVCSFAVFLASFDFLDTSQGKWAISCSIISIVVVVVGQHFVKRKKMGGPKASKGVAVLLLLMWIFGVGVLTFDEPFKSTGNGFFASWGAVIVAAMKTYSELFQQKVAWMQGLRRSMSITGMPLTSEAPNNGPRL